MHITTSASCRPLPATGRRGITGGSSMDESGRFQLYAQLRLLHMLGALPRAASLSSEVKKCISTATGTERNLLQYG